MESLRLVCDRDAQILLQKMESFTASFSSSMDSIKARAEETVQNQGELGRLKSSLTEADAEFVKVLAVKTQKEAKQLFKRARRDEYTAIMSQQSLALATSKETEHQDIDHKREIQEAMLWYNMVLGFKIEGGRGVKFTFNNINLKNPYEEYSFAIRYENDMYTLLACDPQVNDTKQLIHELNKTNGLFKFVRKLREKFQEAAPHGFLPQPTTLHQETTISVSAPGFFNF
ncbi:hypothetical protein OIU76_022231 [Salix suchowensis]|nr:hypothetical protein OIU76_022231 [Salix suchowensis]